MTSFLFRCRLMFLSVLALLAAHDASQAQDMRGCGSRAAKSQYEIGVYYYPGWHTAVGRPKAVNSPWDPIYGYPDRKPILGWYKGDQVDIVKQQMRWMCDYGLKYVVFDWYYYVDHTRLDEPLKTYLSLKGEQPQFSILWANHGQRTTAQEWDRIVEFWAANYLDDPRFYTIDGRKVVFIFSLDRMAEDARLDGASLSQWLRRAQDLVKARGGKGLYFVAGVNAGSLALPGAADAGISAFSTYNFQSGPRDKQPAHGYPALDQAYRRQWKALSDLRKLPLIVPITSGWDRQPWGGSSRDNSMATPSEFHAHMAAARAAMDAGGVRRGVICCWNEYGEGSMIEPTRKHRFKMLDAVKRVFAP